MSSTEPPSRMPPRGQSQETKAARDEISSKGKVEKVREVDADETRKRKFLKYYEEDSPPETDGAETERPTPFDLYSGKAEAKEEDSDAPVASAPPPPHQADVPLLGTEKQEKEDGLPHSEDFWKKTDFPPDRPIPPHSLQEKPSAKKEPKGAGKKENQKEEIVSPFALPSKVEKKKAPSSQSSPLQPETKEVPKSKEGTFSPKVSEREKRNLQAKETERTSDVAYFRSEEREKEGKRGEKIELESASLPPLPAHIQPLAAAATTQAASYIHPSTMSLFFQMVGTMYVMAGTPGVQLTEIVLNSPAYAESKFYGSIIRIEKYATAPDSFNITLSGSNQAVVSFKENVPGLLAAFQNGQFPFKVNRLDVEYRIEKPVYRRKERDDPSDGDLGERRN